MSKNYASVVIRCSANTKEKQENCEFCKIKNKSCLYKTDLVGTPICLNDSASQIALGKLGL